MRRSFAIAVLVCVLSPGRGAGEEATAIPYVPDQEVIEELKDAPQTDAARAEKLVELFRQAGLTEVEKQEVAPPSRSGAGGEAQPVNVVAVFPGESKERIVVGAHTDFRKAGTGVIDDWSGAAMLANLAQTLKRVPRTRTFVFVGFTLEERGMVGSRSYVRSLPDDERAAIKAMVNLECLGVSETFVWQTGSADALEGLARRVASEVDHRVILRQLYGVAADSNSFMAVGIPAITFDSLRQADFRLIDSPNDRFSAMDQELYLTQYRFIVHYLLALDRLEGPVDPANKDRPHR